MKNKILLLLLLLTLACNLMAQWHPGAKIDINNIKTTLYGTGDFMRYRGGSKWDHGYFVPSTGEAGTIYQNNLWIGGLDTNDSLHVAAVRFYQIGDDFWSGPLRVTDASTDIYGVMDYHHVWKVTRAEIEALIANPGGDIPEDILTWPANGNVNDGYAENLAPFVDVDGDGIYNPHNGDYPDILGDMALYCIYNDNYNYYNENVVLHGSSGGGSLGVEIHCMLYGFNAPDDLILNNTLFMRQWIYNRSSNDYHDVYIGYFTDFDIGNSEDDYFGCNVENGYYYGYNSSNFDEVYGNNIPAQIVMILGGPAMDADGLDNPKYDSDGNQIVDESINGLGFGDGIIDNERLGMTQFKYQYAYDVVYYSYYEMYNEMKGLWKSGNAMQYGGNGGSTGVGPECKFIFPYDSDPYNWGTNGIIPNGGLNQNGNYWSAETSNMIINDDHKCLASSGPFTFESGSVEIIDRAYVTCWFTNGFYRDEMDEWATYIKNYFLNNLNK